MILLMIKGVSILRNKLKGKLPIMLVLTLASFVNIWGLWNESVNNYYSAGVFSMGQSLHAFFYNSIDSVGFISIDKPPLGLLVISKTHIYLYQRLLGVAFFVSPPTGH